MDRFSKWVTPQYGDREDKGMKGMVEFVRDSFNTRGSGEYPTITYAEEDDRVWTNEELAKQIGKRGDLAPKGRAILLEMFKDFDLAKKWMEALQQARQRDAKDALLVKKALVRMVEDGIFTTDNPKASDLPQTTSEWLNYGIVIP